MDSDPKPGSGTDPTAQPTHPPAQTSPVSKSRKSRKRLILVESLGAVSILAASLAIAAWSSQNLKAPDVLRTYGVVGNVTALLSKQSPNSTLAPATAFLLQTLVRKNQHSQFAALSGGAVSSAVGILEQSPSSLGRRAALSLLEELGRGNTEVKDAIVKQGGLEAISHVIRKDESESLTAKAAEAAAILAADGSTYHKKAAVKAGLVLALLEYLEGGNAARSRCYVNAAWALANLALDSSHVQAELLEAGGPELLTKLLKNGAGQRITQPAIYGTGNLAAQNSAAQSALREAGALQALVDLIGEAVKGRKAKASEPFHTEILEHVAELQRRDPAVRSALAEVGGLEELLGIIEAGADIKPPAASSSSQLVAVEDDSEDEAIHTLRALVRDLQDEVDSEGSLLPEVKVPSLSLRSASGERALEKPRLGSKQQVASDAAWALGLLVANNADCQNAARDAGAVEGLVRLLESAEDAFVAKGALGAISQLVKNNPENKAAVREAHGVEGLVKLLASNPADKEVLKATAHALKFMTTERPAYEALQRSSSRWLRVLGRQGSQILHDVTGLNVTPFSVSAGFVVSWLLTGGVIILSLGKAVLSQRQPGKSTSA